MFLADEHIGLLATAIFNPMGPTVHTLSLASFDGVWDADTTVLLWRMLHPFSDDRVQILARIPAEDVGVPVEVFAYALVSFIANNGRSPASRDWAEPFLSTTPSGIVIPDRFQQYEGMFRIGFRYLLRHMDATLARDADRLEEAGPDFWKLASMEMDRVNTLLCTGGTAALHDGPDDQLRLHEELVDHFDLDELPESAEFSRWWDLVSNPAYQDDLYRSLPVAWAGAIGQVPGLAQLAGGGDTDDFLAWLRLFRPIGDRNN